MASWREVVAFSQGLGYVVESDEIVTSTPMRNAYVIRLDENGQRAATQMRWGFPDFKKQNLSAPKFMHARCETIDTLPTFSEAFELRRGIVLTHVFNEGQEVPGRKSTRQWTITPRDGRPIPIAVIYEDMQMSDGLYRFFVMVTTPANALIAKNTHQDRMPAIMTPEHWDVWLGETRAPLAEIKALLRTYDDAGDWDMTPQGKSPQPKPPNPQADLF